VAFISKISCASYLPGLELTFHRVHDAGDFSDCKIVCGWYEANVHKVVLGTQSDYFKTAFKKGTFKVCQPYRHTRCHVLLADQ